MPPLKAFTGRELAVIEHLRRAKTNKQIALALGVSVRTVEFHLSRIYSKLGVASRAEAIVRLAENHRWESTVEKGEPRPQDTPSPESTPRIPMRTRAYLSALSLTIVLAAIVLFTKTPTTVPAPQPTSAPSPITAPTSGNHTVAPPIPTSPPSDALPQTQFQTPPQSFTSSTGVRVELNDLAYGPNCLRLQILAYGLPSPNGPPEDSTLSPFSDISLFDPDSPSALTLEQLGGGGGGGLAADGSMFMGREDVYDFAPPSLEGPILLTVRVVTDEALGFDEPLLFHLKALPSSFEMCGLQGSLGP